MNCTKKIQIKPAVFIYITLIFFNFYRHSLQLFNIYCVSKHSRNIKPIVQIITQKLIFRWKCIQNNGKKNTDNWHGKPFRKVEIKLQATKTNFTRKKKFFSHDNPYLIQRTSVSLESNQLCVKWDLLLLLLLDYGIMFHDFSHLYMRRVNQHTHTQNRT